MKKFSVNFSSLNTKMVKAIAMTYKDGFRDEDVISFSELDKEMTNRIKLVIENTMFFVSSDLVKVIIEGKFNEDFLIPHKDEDNCDAEFC